MDLSSNVRIISYNILSSALCRTAYFPKTLPKHTKPYFRVKLLETKLRNELVSSPPRPTVICLQEVNRDQASHLTAFFTKHNYQFVYCSYGQSLGVGIAYSSNTLNLISQQTIHLGKSKVGGWITRNPAVSMLNKLQSWWWSAPPPSVETNSSGTNTSRTKKNPWDLARSTSKEFVTLHLACKSNPRLSFHVASVHMPCHFYNPAAMTIYTTICFQAMQTLAQGLPLIVAGDFNFKPTSPQYSFLTQNHLPPKVNDLSDVETHNLPSMPSHSLYFGDPFRFRLKHAMSSAYGQKEPRFTNYVFTSRSLQTFKATLDYIFYSPPQPDACTSLTLLETRKLPCERIEKSYESLPSVCEPSDHLMIAADFKLSMLSSTTTSV